MENIARLVGCNPIATCLLREESDTFALQRQRAWGSLSDNLMKKIEPSGNLAGGFNFSESTHKSVSLASSLSILCLMGGIFTRLPAGVRDF
jgi:hypothetical protein